MNKGHDFPEISEEKAMEICRYVVKHGRQSAVKKYGENAVDDAMTR